MPRISHSSLVVFNKCPFKYKIRYKDRIKLDHLNVHSVFGNSIHKTLESLIQDPLLNTKEFFQNKFKELLKLLPEEDKQKIFRDKDLKEIAKDMMMKGGDLSVSALAELHRKFPGFKLVGVEVNVVEPITDYDAADYEYNGYIDLVIQTPDGKYHIIDWKTCSWGWKAEKKTDKIVTYQLSYYKHFYGLNQDIERDNIETHFALIKRTAKKDVIEIFRVSNGQKKINNALKILNNMIYNVDHNRFPKNKLSCGYCEYHRTQWCP